MKPDLAKPVLERLDEGEVESFIFPFIQMYEKEVDGVEAIRKLAQRICNKFGTKPVELDGKGGGRLTHKEG